MKTVVMMGGLGSQMFKYAFYLHLQELSGEKCYISTIPYLLKEMWNGYELERIFGLHGEKIEDFFDEKQILDYCQSDIEYTQILFQMMNHLEPGKEKCRINRGYIDYGDHKSLKQKICQKIQNQSVKCRKKEEYIDEYIFRYWKKRGNVIYDEFNHTSDKYIKLQEKIKGIFKFPEFNTSINMQVCQKMLETESVAVHIRRGDHMYDNKALFERAYFKKAISYIKNRIEHSVFYIFSDDFGWCKENKEELGFDYKDEIYYVDWNCGEDSYRDMQLMTYCKHNVLCISSFSWWGYYLSKREDKIVCAPEEYWFEVDIHF